MAPSLDAYDIISAIGSGSYGTCKKIRRKKDGKILVWKELDYGTMTETEKSMLVSEVNLLRELKHQHIVRYYDRIIDRSTSTLYIIMEYCEGGDLSTYINKMKKEGRTTDEAFVWRIGHQVASALKECHCRTKNGKAVLHRDLKPANVFLDCNQDVKLGDFGLARVLNHDTSFARTFVGTPYYMSPEQMNNLSYNEKSDIWSLGCLLYELCALRPPFTASNQKELATRITGGVFQRLPLRYSSDLNELITFMLQVDELRRPTISKLLEHPLLVKHCPSLSSSTGSKVKSLKREEERLSDLEKQLRSRDTKLLEKEKDLIDRERGLLEREREVRQRETAVESKEKLVAQEMKKAEDKIIRVEKLLEAYRPQLESTRKPVPLPTNASGDYRKPDTLMSHKADGLSDHKVDPHLDREPGELPPLDLSDSGTADHSELVDFYIRGKSTGKLMRLGRSCSVSSISALKERVKARRTLWSSGAGKSPQPGKSPHSRATSVEDYYSPSIHARLLGTPPPERKASEEGGLPRVPTPRPSEKVHKRRSLVEILDPRSDLAEVAARVSRPRPSLGSPISRITSPLDSGLRDKMLQLFRKSPPARTCTSYQPLLKRDAH